MKSIFQTVWKPAKFFMIRDLDTKLFMLPFFSLTDKDYVLIEVPGPWSLVPGPLSSTTVSMTRFWVKAMMFRVRNIMSFANFLRSNIGISSAAMRPSG